MTSIAAAGTGAAGYLSPRDRVQNELQSEVSSGAISSTDQTALSTALDDIEQSLKADRAGGGQASGPPSPDQIKSKITDLINGEVQNGTLTSAQATELQNVFANAFAKGGPGGAGGHHGHHHHDGDSGSARWQRQFVVLYDDPAVGDQLELERWNDFVNRQHHLVDPDLPAVGAEFAAAGRRLRRRR